MARYRREKPKSIMPVVGVLLCLAAMGGFLALYNLTGIFKPKEQPLPGPGTNTPGSTVDPNPGDPGTTPPTPAAEGKVIFRFTGRFDRTGDTRKVVFRCPFCKKDLGDINIPKCLHCGKPLKWPASAPCGFCRGTGKCGVCGGSGKCPFCSKGPRLLMGVRPPCPPCNRSGKCPACSGSKECSFCQGGTYFLGKPPAASKEKPPEQPEQPEIPKPKQE